jgi:uracil permease
MSQASKPVIGYLPDERPPVWKLIPFALQQILVMFPATVLVAVLTKFDISTTIFASGFATLCFLLVTRGKIPLFYGSSFSYIAAIVSITGAQGVDLGTLISRAQFGIIMSGLVSIVAGLVINFFGTDKIEFVLPPTVTGSIAIVIGISLAGVAMRNASGWNLYGGEAAAAASSTSWTVAIITLLATVLFSVYLKGTFGQLPLLFGIIVGYISAVCFGMIDFSKVLVGPVIAAPGFSLPIANWAAVLAIMPIAIATIPESTAHLFQLDIYVDHLAKLKGKGSYNIKKRLGWNLIGDGIGDIVSAAVGGPAGTNYGENLSTMAITRVFSTAVLGVAAIITMLIAFLTPLSNIVKSIPNAVVGGVGIYLFGIIGAQGIAIMISRKVDMFDARNLAVIASILVIGLGGAFGFVSNGAPDGGMIPIFGIQLPAIATAAVFGIVLNLLLSIGRKHEPATEADAAPAADPEA